MPQPPSTDSAAGKLREFLRNRPSDWFDKSPAERRALAAKASKMTPSYLNNVIHKREEYKDLFGVERRKKNGRKKRRKAARRKGAAKPTAPAAAKTSPPAGSNRVKQVLSQVRGFELSELVVIAKAIRKDIRSQFEAVKKEIDELKSL